MSRAAALRKAFATVSCPACNHSVEAPFINAHLDSGCRKYGRRSSATKYVSGGGRSHQEDDGSHPKDSSFGREPSLKRCREVHEEDTAGVGSSAAATTKPTTVAAAEGTASQVFTIFRREAGNGSRPKTASQLAAEAEILKCIAPDLLALSRARVYPITPCAKSWVVHVPRWFSMSTDDFDALWERHPEQQATVVLFGQEVTCSRWNKMYGQDYVFSGQRSASSGPLSPGDDGCGPQLLAAFERVCTLRHNRSSAPAPPNGVLLNWYADGSHYIGPHSDDETQLAPGAPIYSVSWGATRRFRLLPRKKTVNSKDRHGKALTHSAGPAAGADIPGESAEAAAKLNLEVGDGDLVVMGGDCQKTHKHEVPKTSQLVGRRINATFRTFAKQVEANRVNGSYP